MKSQVQELMLATILLITCTLLLTVMPKAQDRKDASKRKLLHLLMDQQSTQDRRMIVNNPVLSKPKHGLKFDLKNSATQLSSLSSQPARP